MQSFTLHSFAGHDLPFCSLKTVQRTWPLTSVLPGYLTSYRNFSGTSFSINANSQLSQYCHQLKERKSILGLKIHSFPETVHVCLKGSLENKGEPDRAHRTPTSAEPPSKAGAEPLQAGRRGHGCWRFLHLPWLGHAMPHAQAARPGWAQIESGTARCEGGWHLAPATIQPTQAGPRFPAFNNNPRHTGAATGNRDWASQESGGWIIRAFRSRGRKKKRA